jgi:hypothetical protein
VQEQPNAQRVHRKALEDHLRELLVHWLAAWRRRSLPKRRSTACRRRSTAKPAGTRAGRFWRLCGITRFCGWSSWSTSTKCSKVPFRRGS